MTTDYTDSDISALKEATEKLLRISGLRESSYSRVLVDLLNTTTNTMNLYVSSTGHDAGTGSATSPFLTIQAALDSLPKVIRHRVTINIGAGNFAGGILEGFYTRPPKDLANTYSGLEVRGTMIPVVPATGSGSGTITGYAAASGNTFAIVTDGTQSWTVNDLRGKFLVVLSGTGFPGTEQVPPIYPIVSNTATTVTILGATGTAATGINATYQIQEPGTLITSCVTVAATTGNSAPAGVSTAAFNVSGCSGGSLVLSRIGCALGTAVPIFLGGTGPGTKCLNIKITIGSGSATFGMRAGGSDVTGAFVVDRSCLSCPSNVAIIGISNSTIQHTVSNCFIDGGGRASSTGVSLQAAGGSGIIGCYMLGLTNGVSCGRGSCGGVLISSTKIDGTGHASAVGILVSQVSSLGMPQVALSLSTTDISNCLTAISLSVPAATGILISCTGTTNTTGILLSQGAKLKVASGVTLTGVTEVSLDAAPTDLATMRGASPKLLTNTYGTLIFE